jgi:N-acetylglucosaminyl-diphospho-decaprenol L-rhamnosyltransferase
MTPQAIVGSIVRPDISVVVVNYNTKYLLERMLLALRAGSGPLIQVVIVDNASSDGSVELLREKYPDVELIESALNVGFGRANNLALNLIRGRYVLLLNTDAFVSADTLAKSVSFMQQNPRCGVLGVKLVGETGVLQPSCRYFPTPWNMFLARTGAARFFPITRLVDDMSWDHNSVRECDWVPGCYYFMRRDVVDRVGLFDPRYFLYFEEVDHCRSVKDAGWTVCFYPLTEVIHIGGESAKALGPLTTAGRQIFAIETESELLYFRKHYGWAGLLADVLLTTLADAAFSFKALIPHRDKDRFFRLVLQIKIRIVILFRTGLGVRPTR